MSITRDDDACHGMLQIIFPALQIPHVNFHEASWTEGDYLLEACAPSRNVFVPDPKCQLSFGQLD